MPVYVSRCSVSHRQISVVSRFAEYTEHFVSPLITSNGTIAGRQNAGVLDPFKIRGFSRGLG